jgi:hypothetical protein
LHHLASFVKSRYNTADEAQAAKATLNGADLCGSSIVVDSWEKGPKLHGPSGPSGPSDGGETLDMATSVFSLMNSAGEKA